MPQWTHALARFCAVLAAPLPLLLAVPSAASADDPTGLTAKLVPLCGQVLLVATNDSEMSQDLLFTVTSGANLARTMAPHATSDWLLPAVEGDGISVTSGGVSIASILHFVEPAACAKPG